MHKARIADDVHLAGLQRQPAPEREQHRHGRTAQHRVRPGVSVRRLHVGTVQLRLALAGLRAGCEGSRVNSPGPGRKMSAMPSAGRTWIVMVRDVSHAVRVEGEPRLTASLVLDADTGLVVGQSVARTGPQACAQAFATALTRPVSPHAPQLPGQVLCSAGLATDVGNALARLTTSAPQPSITEIGPVAEAEDIFDSLVGHLAGRRQPGEFPTPPDWQLLVNDAREYYQAEPWTRWSDAVTLTLAVTIGGVSTPYVAIVIGNQGIQRGLVLYPGYPAAAPPSGPRGRETGRPISPPPGTLMFFLDPRSQPPPEFTAKATRYGWPEEADLVPMWVSSGPDGPSDVSRLDVQHLTMAITAVLARDARGPVVLRRATDRTTGRRTLADGQQGTFTISQETTEHHTE